MVSKPEPFVPPEIKNMIGWRPNEDDKKNLRLLMTARRETSFSQLLRDLVEEECVHVRKRWSIAAKRIAALEGGDHAGQ